MTDVLALPAPPSAALTSLASLSSQEVVALPAPSQLPQVSQVLIHSVQCIIYVLFDY